MGQSIIKKGGVEEMGKQKDKGLGAELLLLPTAGPHFLLVSPEISLQMKLTASDPIASQ